MVGIGESEALQRSTSRGQVTFESHKAHYDFPQFTPRPNRWTLVAGDGLSIEYSVSVVIPAKNEARNLPYILPQIPSGIWEIIVVDGNSTDDTVEVAKSIRSDVRVIPQPGRGKGDALRAGFDAATGDIIVMLDADGSMSPREIPRYVEALVNGAELVTGSRSMSGALSSDITPLRGLGNAVLARVFTGLYGVHVTDLCYGYMAFWRRCVPTLALDADGFEIETLINVRAAKAGLRVEEVPSDEARRLHGSSNLRTFRDGFRVLRTLWEEREARFRLGGRNRGY
jgi:glycosyltransferase involved in cell wall biosynthesis